MQQLGLGYNQFEGTIPNFLGNLTELIRLNLGSSKLHGTIPKSLGNLTKLQSLTLGANQLCGDIPLSFMNLSNISISISRNHLTASDPNLINWLNSNAPNWAKTQTPCPQPSCLVYAIHDEGLNDSQLFTIAPEDNFTVQALGTTHFGHDLEGMAIHPKTKELFVSSGDDQADDLPNGHIYQVDKTNGILTSICNTGLGEVSAMSFHPIDNTLWVWADAEGLFTVDIEQCLVTEITKSKAKVEGLTWDNSGETLYGSAGKTLYSYTNV